MGVGFMRVVANKGRLMRGVGVNFGVEIWLARRDRKPKIAVGGKRRRLGLRKVMVLNMTAY